MRIVKRLALDAGRLAIVVAVTFFTWIGVWVVLDFIHYGPVASTLLATGLAVLNAFTASYNVSPLDTQE